MNKRSTACPNSLRLNIEHLEPRSLLAGLPLITEFLALNEGQLLDGDGNASDWIEIQNMGDSVIELSGYGLTNDPNNLLRWEFPDVNIDPGEFLVVFASDKDVTDYVDAEGNFHTDFALNSGGGYLALVGPDGADVSQFEYAEQSPGVSYGLALEQTLLNGQSLAEYWHPISNELGDTWTTVGFDGSGRFSTGQAAMGYETEPKSRDSFLGAFVTDLAAESLAVYSRVEFDVQDVTAIANLNLAMKYDNGFVAYLNGVRVAEANAPERVDWFSTALDNEPRDSQALQFRHFDLTPHVDRLVVGTNVLAIHGLNHLVDLGDMLLAPKLTATTKVGFMATPSPGSANVSDESVFSGFVSTPQISADTGNYNEPFNVEITTETSGAHIRFTTDGNPPTLSTGIVYSGPIQIGATTDLRVVAFKDNYIPSHVITRSYVFSEFEGRVQGRVWNDINGDGSVQADETGQSGVTIYVDVNNDGERNPDEPSATTHVINPNTPEDETGSYMILFDRPGSYILRQEPPEGFMQTSPLPEIQSFDGAAVASLHPTDYTFRFDGSITEIAAPLPNDWQAIGLDGQWEIDFTFAPHREPDDAGVFHVIEEFVFRMRSRDGSVAVGHQGELNPNETSIEVANQRGIQIYKVSIPIGEDLNWVLELEAPNARLNDVPLGGDIDLSIPLAINRAAVQDGNGNAILLAAIGGHEWDVKIPMPHGFPVDVGPAPIDDVDFLITLDGDGDGLPTFWEVNGLPCDEPGVRFTIPGADPRHRDLYVDVDAMEGLAPRRLSPTDGVRYFPFPRGLERTRTVLDHVIAAFLQAPAESRSRTPGIRLHIDLDEEDLTREAWGDDWIEFDAIKEAHFGGKDVRNEDGGRASCVRARKLVYRYAVFADTRGNEGSSGLAELPGNDFMVTLGSLRGAESDEQQSGTFMHELGHSLGLAHGGDDHLNNKPNYVSVMNYAWQLPNSNIGWKLDYSREELARFDTRRLNNIVSIDANESNYREIYIGPPESPRRIPIRGSVELDPSKALPGYFGFFQDSDGRGRFYELFSSSASQLEDASIITGHDDWASFDSYAMAPWVHPSSQDGVHFCSTQSDHSNCLETNADYTNVFALGPDSFEPNDTPTQAQPIGDADGDGEYSDVFRENNLHEDEGSANEDWFTWIANAVGELVVRIIFRSDIDVEMALNVSVTRDGLTTTYKGTNGDTPDAGFKKVAVSNILPNDEVIVHVSMQNDATQGYYLLEINGPDSGIHWHGDTSEPNFGAQGDGFAWSDERNWAVEGLNDSPLPTVTANSDFTFFPQQDHEDQEPTILPLPTPVIDLETVDRVVESLQFNADYTLCEPGCRRDLRITGDEFDDPQRIEGKIDVRDGVTATINADLKVGPDGAEDFVPRLIRKTNQGTLVVNTVNQMDSGQIVTPAFVVTEGTLEFDLSASDTVEALGVWPQARVEVSPSNTSRLRVEGETRYDGNIRIEGTLVLDVKAEGNDELVGTGIQFDVTESSRLEVRAIGPLSDESERERRLVDGAYFGNLVGHDRSDQGLRSKPVENHAGFGVFVHPAEGLAGGIADGTHVVLCQALAGDANGDGSFDQQDIILVLSHDKYEADGSGEEATWIQGDWTGDGKFSTQDIVAARQTGLYSSEDQSSDCSQHLP